MRQEQVQFNNQMGIVLTDPPYAQFTPKKNPVLCQSTTLNLSYFDGCEVKLCSFKLLFTESNPWLIQTISCMDRSFLVKERINKISKLKILFLEGLDNVLAFAIIVSLGVNMLVHQRGVEPNQGPYGSNTEYCSVACIIV